MNAAVLEPPRTKAAPASAYKWRVVLMLWSICFFNYADRQAIFSVFPKLTDEFHFDKFQLGLIGSAFMWTYAFGAPVAGFIADRVRRKDLILGGCVFWSAITALTGWCGNLWQFIIVRGLEGLGETFYFPASLSLASDYHGPKTRSRALAIHQSGVYVGTIAGSWAGAWFAEKMGWRAGFYCFGIAGALLALALYKLLHEPRRGEVDRPPEASGRISAEPLSPVETLRAIFRAPAALLLMAAFLGANFVAAIFLAWTPTFLVEKFGFKLAAAGLSGTAFIHLASAVSVPMAGLLADRLVRRLAGGRLLVQALGLLAGAVFVFLVGMTSDVRTLLTAMACFGFCKGFYDSNIFAALYDLIEPRARATATGLMNTVGWGGGALGPVYIGWAAGHFGQGSEMANMSQAIAWCGAVYLAGAALLLAAIFLLRAPSPPGYTGSEQQ
ncbi:MAG TPA: MFS transporter [Verrucomicrobiae bacterium]|nr:MFS transporter [Verrucomicrobiae bacterium]